MSRAARVRHPAADDGRRGDRRHGPQPLRPIALDVQRLRDRHVGGRDAVSSPLQLSCSGETAARSTVLSTPSDSASPTRTPGGQIRAGFGVARATYCSARWGTSFLERACCTSSGRCRGFWTATPRVKLLVVGDEKGSADYLAEVRHEAKELGVAEAIRWAGHRRDIPQILSALDVYVLASLEESFPLSILEAMAAGLPVVATAVGGIPECVIPGENGQLTAPGDPDPLAASIIPVAQSVQLRRRLGTSRAASRRWPTLTWNGRRRRLKRSTKTFAVPNARRAELNRDPVKFVHRRPKQASVRIAHAMTEDHRKSLPS